jgi:hypothetical protein
VKNTFVSCLLMTGWWQLGHAHGDPRPPGPVPVRPAMCASQHA